MANIILAGEIRKAFTQKVAEYLGKGMEISIATMSGHQGEICKTDVTDGKDIYRINLDRESCYDLKADGSDARFYGDMIVLTVEKFTEQENRAVFDDWHTLWTGKGEQVEKMVWYDVSRTDRRKAFVATIEEAEEIQNIKTARYRARDSRSERAVEIKLQNDEQRTVVRDMIRNHRGYGKVKRAHIQKVEKMIYDSSVQYVAYFTKECGKSSLTFKTFRR